MKTILLSILLSVAGSASALFAQTFPPGVRIHTNLGDIDVVLTPDVTPKTVENFLGYVDRGDYNNTFIHRSVPNFVIQGGGYALVNGQTNTVPEQPPVVNEFKASNLRGTIAMAKLGNDPNSATSQWFFNLGDNSANLDNQNGGFTVFGKVRNKAGLAVVDAIAALPTHDSGSPFDALPVLDYTTGPIENKNLVTVISVTRIEVHPNFFDGEASLGSNFYYLAFPNGNIFGYYSYQFFPYLYHQELGFEYFIDANDGQGGAYLYDFASGGFFYTSPNFPFPYLYDFSLNTTVYYFADPNNPGHYSANPRYFANLSTGAIFTK